MNLGSVLRNPGGAVKDAWGGVKNTFDTASDWVADNPSLTKVAGALVPFGGTLLAASPLMSAYSTAQRKDELKDLLEARAHYLGSLAKPIEAGLQQGLQAGGGLRNAMTAAYSQPVAAQAGQSMQNLFNTASRYGGMGQGAVEGAARDIGVNRALGGSVANFMGNRAADTMQNDMIMSKLLAQYNAPLIVKEDWASPLSQAVMNFSGAALPQAGSKQRSF